MATTLTIHNIGTQEAVTTRYSSTGEAYTALVEKFGHDHLRGDEIFGTIGGLTGRVFQPSWTYRIEQVPSRYAFHWKGQDEPEILTGLTPEAALNDVGYGAGALAALDYFEELKEQS